MAAARQSGAAGGRQGRGRQWHRRSIRIALPNRNAGAGPPSAAEMHALRDLALLLERTNRLDALRRLLDDAERLGIARDQLGYPAAAIALRDGEAAEAKRLLELEGSATPTRFAGTG